MMLPAQEIPEEDPIRTGPEGAVGTPAEAPADAGIGTDADKVVQPDTGVRVGRAAQADAEVAARGDSVDAAAGRKWSEVLAMFVDDPRGSVTEASAIVDEAVNAFIAATRGRQASLAASWQAQDTDTEQLRVALRDYRTFWTGVTRLPQSA
jgi:hypothetical protein